MSDSEQKADTQNSSKAKRFITGSVVGLIALYSLLAGGIYLLLLLLAMIIFSVIEYHKVLRHKGFLPSISLMLIASISFAVLVFLRCFEALPAVMVLTIISSFLVVLFKGRQPYIANVATTALGFIYAGWLPTYILLINQFQTSEINFFSIQINEASSLVITVFLTIVATDVGAWFFGSKYGKHKLAPIISPKKTIEGAVGGVLWAVVVAMTGLINTKLTILQCAILGIVVSISSQLGDLSESLIKRDAGVKDSSDILPGHGGFLDRVDSYVFALPVAYYYIKYFTHGTNIFFDGFQYIKGLLSAWGM